MWCNYCKHIEHGKEETKGKCSITGSLRYFSQISCKEFEPGTEFYCKECFCVENIENCLHIQRCIKSGDPLHNGFAYSECKKCTQKTEIKSVDIIIAKSKPLVLVKRKVNNAPEPDSVRKKPLVLKKRNVVLVKRNPQKITLIKRKGN